MLEARGTDACSILYIKFQTFSSMTLKALMTFDKDIMSETLVLADELLSICSSLGAQVIFYQPPYFVTDPERLLSAICWYFGALIRICRCLSANRFQVSSERITINGQKSAFMPMLWGKFIKIYHIFHFLLICIGHLTGYKPDLYMSHVQHASLWQVQNCLVTKHCVWHWT